MVDIGGRIKALRTERHMTQAQLAHRLGVTKSSVSAYENGSRSPSYDILLQLSRVFQVSADILLTGTDRSAVLVDASGLTPEQLSAIRGCIQMYRTFNAVRDSLSQETQRQLDGWIQSGYPPQKSE